MEISLSQSTMCQKNCKRGFPLFFPDLRQAKTGFARTQSYCAETASEQEKETIEHMYQAIVAREKWDLVILVEPNTKYVDDGFRDMTMSAQEIRDAFTQHLEDLLKPFHDKMVRVNGNFFENYETVKGLIEDKLEIGI